MKTSNPRRAAYEILCHVEKDKCHADILIDGELSKGALLGPDRGLLRELVLGVLRRRGTLDYIINFFSRQKSEKLERSVLVLLRLGLYQSFFLDRIPVSAAVNETVKLAGIFVPRACGFINAVLRRADRERDAISWPDRSTHPADFLAAFYSHPKWLAEDWIRQFGFEEAELLAKSMDEIPPLTFRTNTLRTTREALLQRLERESVKAEKCGFSPEGIRVLSPVNPAVLPSFAEGLFTVQDESSQLASILLAPDPGNAVLDACAAPGGKATHLAQLMLNRGSVLACDLHVDKLRLIDETARRLGISIIGTQKMDAANPAGALSSHSFDRILVDAPCSGLGVLRRNPEGKWSKTRADVRRLAGLQKLILANLANHLSNDGIMVYSTCSTSAEENEGVIDDFLTARSDFMVEDLREIFPEYSPLFTDRGYFRSWPHRVGMDGFFAARLRRKDR
ncbi:MAG TPA: 16S rRNA (cytosine(967)-C(5))-methyltransferase RsmB [Geobacteraceae bacterium]|nr:16S rRNA (cytosine(967)-C(5))-methyltransferase RsmB [Geobacteraceae bacterium]